MNIITVKGPIGKDQLAVISSLYGRYDYRFATPEACEQKFNRNPFGYSFHAFAYDDEQIVAHCAVIPLRIIRGREKRVSGKAEAMIVKEGYRAKRIVEEGRKCLLAVAVTQRVYDFALSQGIEVVHALSLQEVVRFINMMIGLQPASINEQMLLFVLRAREVRALVKGYIQAECVNGVYLLHKAVYVVASFVLMFLPRIHVTRDENLDDQLTAIEDQHVVSEDSWAIAKDKETLHWFFQGGRIVILRIDGSYNDYVILWWHSKPGRSLWIIDWGIRTRNLFFILRTLQLILKFAKNEGASSVVFPYSSLGTDSALRRKVLLAARAFLFVSHRQRMDLFVKSIDPFYADAGNIRFDSFFYQL